MSKSSQSRPDLLVAEIDEALGQSPALTEQQVADIGHLRAQLLELCQAGEMEEARRCQELALTSIRNGAPVPE